jgi:hypothetical protein
MMPATPDINWRSPQETPRMLPKSMCDKSRKERVRLINRIPRANMPVKTTPMAVSSLSRCLREIQPPLETDAVLEKQVGLGEGHAVLRCRLEGVSIAIATDQCGKFHLIASDIADKIAHHTVRRHDFQLAITRDRGIPIRATAGKYQKQYSRE